MLSSLNDAFVDFVDDESFFQFSLEDEFSSLLYVYMTFATNTEAESPCFEKESLSIQMNFRRVIARKKIRGHVNMVIYLIGSFLKFSFLIS